MKLCFFINNLKIGGAERFVVEQLRFLLVKHPDSLIYLVTIGSACDFPEISSLPLAGRMVLPPGGHWRRVLSLRRFFLENGIDCCISHLETANKINALAGWLSRTSTIEVVHSINIYPRGSFKERLARLFYNIFSSKIVAISDSIASYLREIGVRSHKITTINNGVDRERFSHAYRYSPRESVFEMLFIGRVEPVKSLDILIQACAKLDARCSSWSLRIVGSGSQLESLREMAALNGLERKIEFLGSSAEPWSHLGGARVLCLVSSREGLPITILEGLSIGVPLLVSRVGYLPALVDERNGRLVAPGSVDELADQLMFFSSMSQPDLYKMGIASREKAKLYDLESCMNAYMALVYGKSRSVNV